MRSVCDCGLVWVGPSTSSSGRRQRLVVDQRRSLRATETKGREGEVGLSTFVLDPFLRFGSVKEGGGGCETTTTLTANGLDTLLIRFPPLRCAGWLFEMRSGLKDVHGSERRLVARGGGAEDDRERTLFCICDVDRPGWNGREDVGNSCQQEINKKGPKKKEDQWQGVHPTREASLVFSTALPSTHHLRPLLSFSSSLSGHVPPSLRPALQGRLPLPRPDEKLAAPVLCVDPQPAQPCVFEADGPGGRMPGHGSRSREGASFFLSVRSSRAGSTRAM